MSPLCYLSCLLEWWEVVHTHVITCRILVEATGYTTITPSTSYSHIPFPGNLPVSHSHTRCSFTCNRLCTISALCLLKQLETFNENLQTCKVAQFSSKFGDSHPAVSLSQSDDKQSINSFFLLWYRGGLVWSGLVWSILMEHGAKTSCSCRQKNVLFTETVLCVQV